MKIFEKIRPYSECWFLLYLGSPHFVLLSYTFQPLLTDKKIKGWWRTMQILLILLILDRSYTNRLDTFFIRYITKPSAAGQCVNYRNDAGFNNWGESFWCPPLWIERKVNQKSKNFLCSLMLTFYLNFSNVEWHQ